MIKLTNILLSFLCFAPLITIAMEDEKFPTSYKRAHEVTEAEEKKEDAQSHKRQRTQAHEIIKELDKKELHGKEYKDKYKGSEKYKRIDDYRIHLKSLKKLPPEFKELILGENPENRLEELKEVFRHLQARYYLNFFDAPSPEDDNSKTYLPQEVKHLILSYVSKQELANLLLVSHVLRDAVFSFLPVFNELVESKQYKDINELLDALHKGCSRAHTAIGIKQYQNPKRKSANNQRNKWLDLAFDEGDFSATSFIFKNKLFINAKGRKDDITKNLAIIEKIYKQQMLGEDLSLDQAIASYLNHLLKQQPDSTDQYRKIEDILRTISGESIEANLILGGLCFKGIDINVNRSLLYCKPNEDSAQRYFTKACRIARTLPGFQEGMAYYEMGFWYLVEGKYWCGSQSSDSFTEELYGYWEAAIDAWTKAEGGNLQKAVTRFEKTLMESPLFSRKTGTDKFSYSNPPYLSTSTLPLTEEAKTPAIAFDFLKNVYVEDDKGAKKLSPYHCDLSLLLRAERYYYSKAKNLSTPILLADLNNVRYYFTNVMMVYLSDCDKAKRNKILQELKKLLDINKNPLTLETLDAYEHMLQQHGLSESNLMPNSVK
ncbi:MAG: F-box protein [Candidatus Paracaedibacteraceae bacterium]|nr:F-box protein [Candidatus Paracaedibacteraceae bacterium]